MPGVAVRGIDFAGGRQLAVRVPWFRINGRPVVVVGDPVEDHGKHSGVTMVQGAAGFRVGGRAVCRAGDQASCGHVTTGRPEFVVR